MLTTVLLTEDALAEHDVDRVVHLHDPEPVRFHVLVPVDTRHNRLVEALDELALGRLREAVTDSGEQPPEQARVRAQAALDASVSALRLAGAEVEGALVGDNPVDDVVRTARELDADEVIVVTQPHLVEESLRRDWASRIRGDLGRPVLHVVSGTDRVV
ncbi:indole-3-glycerol phosphate synthase [Vallicoccus soli]|uniref:Indole-3-glycerol phosphate synthase n=1 Tax=Vallicoccus soli TaxID=2339232 RepID=A0A3A3YT32_9ACTN|nr:indole-3-glycerol phosphate synthase [Vallicoccus soli]RJK92929.1 indole-3-glycerol phosphate synthase [Vallicoccus soli]